MGDREREERFLSLSISHAKYRRTLCLGESLCFYCVLIFFRGLSPCCVSLRRREVQCADSWPLLARDCHRHAANQRQQGCVPITPQRNSGRSFQTGSLPKVCACCSDLLQLGLVSLQVASCRLSTSNLKCCGLVLQMSCRWVNVCCCVLVCS